MKVHGYTIAPEIELAVVERMKRTTFTLGEIMAEFDRSIACDAKPFPPDPFTSLERADIVMRAADRMIQRQRKVGNIAIQSRGQQVTWKWVA